MHSNYNHNNEFNSHAVSKPALSGNTGAMIAPRKSPVLSRSELRRLIVDMVD